MLGWSGWARRRGGVTLIELVVVLAILGILIALAVPRYVAARKKAYKAEADKCCHQSVQIPISGTMSPLGAADRVSILFSSDGSSTGGSTFWVGIRRPGALPRGTPSEILEKWAFYTCKAR
jgi:prepilin-type N-terminal cleavage/methylation domain-containing protein